MVAKSNFGEKTLAVMFSGKCHTIVVGLPRDRLQNCSLPCRGVLQSKTPVLARLLHRSGAQVHRSLARQHESLHELARQMQGRTTHGRHAGTPAGHAGTVAAGFTVYLAGFL